MYLATTLAASDCTAGTGAIPQIAPLGTSEAAPGLRAGASATFPIKARWMVACFHSDRPSRLAPATLRYEYPELQFYAADSHRGFCHAQPRPQRGTSPRATFPVPAPFGFQLSLE